MNQSPRTSSNSPPSNNGSKYPHSYMNNNSPSPTSSYNPNMANRNFNQYHNQRPPYWNNNSMYQQQFYPQQMNYPLMGYSPQNNYQQFNPNFGIQPQGMMYQSNNNFHPNFNNGNMNPNFGKNVWIICLEQMFLSRKTLWRFFFSICQLFYEIIYQILIYNIYNESDLKSSFNNSGLKKFIYHLV